MSPTAWAVHRHALALSDLMNRSRRHDDDFERFFLAHFERIATSVAYVCGDAERASDATQEAFIKAHRRWSRLRDYDNPATWIRRAAINATRDAHRADTRRARREQRVSEPTDAVVDPEPHDGSALEILASLPDRQRAIAALYYLDDMPVAEISDVLDIAEGTVRFHLSQARTALRRTLRQPQEERHGR